MVSYQLHYQPESGQWLAFSAPVARVVADRPDQVLAALQKIERSVEQDGLFAAGWVGYGAAPGFDQSLPAKAEPGQPLLGFTLYQNLQFLPSLPEDFPGTRSTDKQRQSPRLDGFDAMGHKQAVGRIKKYLQEGDSYQVNYTQQILGKWSSGSEALFRELYAVQPQAYAAYLLEEHRAICSVSPELFFALQGEHIRCKPMKGTARRGRTFVEDQLAAAALSASVKDQAENLMIVDMVRNDLGRVARTGSVVVDRLFELEKYPTVWQLTSTIRAQTEASVTQIFSALFPCASIVGAPKGRTMEIIDELESRPRGLYTGAIGWLMPGRQAQFNVAIRTAIVDDQGQLSYGVGGGIVWDSDPDLEARECLDKARILAAPPIQRLKLLETLRWSRAEGYWLLEEHLKRLGESARYHDYPFDRAGFCAQLLAAATSFSMTVARVRLTLAVDGELHITHQPLEAVSRPVKVRVYDRPLS
ncbi:MAG: aminodeoxychorismate synthase component I, partial [Gammaproteobacteria bacterium]